MLKTFLGVVSIILALFLIIFGVYVYVYFKSRKTIKLDKKDCISSNCDIIGNDCIIWNEADKKCYPGGCMYSDYTKTNYCKEDMNNNSIEDWQKNALISSSIIFVLCVVAYFVKE